MNDLTREHLAEIRARAEAATPGEWRYHPEDMLVCAGGNEFAPLAPYIACAGADATDADMELVAHAREDVPALLDECARLTSESSRLRAELEAAKGDLRMVATCEMCKYSSCDAEEQPCSGCGLNSVDHWEWRGIQPAPSPRASGPDNYIGEAAVECGAPFDEPIGG